MSKLEELIEKVVIADKHSTIILKRLVYEYLTQFDQDWQGRYKAVNNLVDMLSNKKSWATCDELVEKKHKKEIEELKERVKELKDKN